MKKLFYAILALPVLAACTATVPQAEYDKMRQMHDSLAEVNEQMELVVSALSSSMDELAAQEGLIFIDDNGNDIQDKNVLLSHMQAFRSQMARQRQEIADLQKQLASSSANSSKLQRLIENLKQQIVQKDAQIGELQATLEQKNISISDLKSKLEVMTQARAIAEESRDYFIDVARSQDDAINTVYYVIGSKKELKELGVSEGTFRKKANYAGFDAGKFTKADLRELIELQISSKSPKLLTEKPESSYTITKNGDGTSTLTITDTEKFWESSPYLVIQL